jgi:hypothetical protein
MGLLSRGDREVRRQRPRSLLMTFARVRTPALHAIDLGDARYRTSVVVFVRNGRPVGRPVGRRARGTPPLDPAQAGLVEDFRAVLPDLRVVCGDMGRAIETARFFGEPIIDARLNEVSWPWTEGFEDALAQYLEGQTVKGWERQGDACARVQAVVDAHGDAIYITYRAVLSLYLASVVPKWNAMQFWTGFAHPGALYPDTGLVRVAEQVPASLAGAPALEVVADGGVP